MAELLSRVAAELALFAGIGFLLFALNDLLVDLIYFGRAMWRAVAGAGAQPGVYRVDVGPRVTMKVRQNLRVHMDYRQRLAGNAEPGSGPALTLAGDF